MAIRWTVHKLIRLLAVVGAAVVFFSLALMGRVPPASQRGLGFVLVGALLLVAALPVALHRLITRAGPNRRWMGPFFDTALLLAGWFTVWLIFATAR